MLTIIVGRDDPHVDGGKQPHRGGENPPRDGGKGHMEVEEEPKWKCERETLLLGRVFCFSPLLKTSGSQSIIHLLLSLRSYFNIS